MDAIRAKATALIMKAGDKPTEELAAEYRAVVEEFLAAGGSSQDMIVKIGSSFFSPKVKSEGPHEDTPLPGSQRLDFDYLEKFMLDSFLAIGVPEKEARICADVLIESDKRGIDSHGVGRLRPIYFDRIAKGILKPYAPIDIVKETSTTALVDGNLGLGLYIGPYCMDLAIKKAKQHGIGFVCAKNSTHYGIAGYYATMATEAGCIGLTGTNARPSIAPTFGVQPCLGTNPLTFGIPSDDEFPFVIDCATSINQRGKIEKYERLNMETPKGMVIDLEGEERTDTPGILKDMAMGKCALCPLGGAGDEMGGYKGFGWATVVELLSTAFQSGPFGKAVSGVDQVTGGPCPMPLGHFFLAIDIEALVGLDTFKQNSGNLLRYIRESTKDPQGPGRIWTAGEPENDARVRRTALGGVVVPPILLSDMQHLRDTLPGMKEKYEKLVFELPTPPTNA
jgi:L-2-hydroxycarboxylate dehydrogenase (NAD+)